MKKTEYERHQLDEERDMRESMGLPIFESGEPIKYQFPRPDSVERVKTMLADGGPRSLFEYV